MTLPRKVLFNRTLYCHTSTETHAPTVHSLKHGPVHVPLNTSSHEHVLYVLAVIFGLTSLPFLS